MAIPGETAIWEITKISAEKLYSQYKKSKQKRKALGEWYTLVVEGKGMLTLDGELLVRSATAEVVGNMILPITTSSYKLKPCWIDLADVLKITPTFVKERPILQGCEDNELVLINNKLACRTTVDTILALNLLGGGFLRKSEGGIYTRSENNPLLFNSSIGTFFLHLKSHDDPELICRYKRRNKGIVENPYGLKKLEDALYLVHVGHFPKTCGKIPPGRITPNWRDVMALATLIISEEFLPTYLQDEWMRNWLFELDIIRVCEQLEKCGALDEVKMIRRYMDEVVKEFNNNGYVVDRKGLPEVFFGNKVSKILGEDGERGLALMLIAVSKLRVIVAGTDHFPSCYHDRVWMA